MGPLDGITVIEIEGIGPGPFCGMMLADMGADVVLVQRKTASPGADVPGTGKEHAIFRRGKRSIALDLKSEEAVEATLRLIEGAEVLIEGFRPGVMERLGLGPEVCLARNPKLVYGRMTGWGQTGPLSHAAGHDINYLAVSGALHYSGHDGEPPFPPATVIGDVGGGGLMLAFGIAAGVISAQRTGQGQVIDAAITDGSAVMTALLFGFYQAGRLPDKRSAHFMSGGAHWYDSYECADGGYITLGALEPKFYVELIERLGLADEVGFDGQFDAAQWPVLKRRIAELIKTKTREQWCELLEGTDVCFGPVLSFGEAVEHPHNKERQTFIDVQGVTQPAPAPRFSATPAAVREGPPGLGEHGREILKAAGYSQAACERLLS